MKYDYIDMFGRRQRDKISVDTTTVLPYDMVSYNNYQYMCYAPQFYATIPAYEPSPEYLNSSHPLGKSHERYE